MRSINCQNIRGEIEAAGSADYLSRAAMAHISSCPACETLSRQQNQLHSILSGLGTVEAPGDFDFKLRARLAAERSAGGSFSFLNFSFAARSAGVAMILLLAGAAILYLSLRVPTNNQVAANKDARPQSGSAEVAKTSDAPTAPRQESQQPAGLSSVKTTDSHDVKRSLVATQNRPHPGSRDEAGTGATVYRASQLAVSYPSTPFPINASRQPLKVSVADGRGGSRTISLPAVSFGSEGGLTQDASPLMASARGAW
ncbi:MAG TPA: hypothetical protein VLL54_04070 [Pyrinomonadaceae bacterium]|nr:hypothetical protein [Pyrinomonadaceae bacterium]